MPLIPSSILEWLYIPCVDFQNVPFGNIGSNMNTPKSMLYFFMFLMECHWHSPSNVHWNTWQACYTKRITFCYIGLCKSWTIWYFGDVDASNLKVLGNLNENSIYEIATNIKFMIEIVWHQYTRGQLMLKVWTKIMLHNSKTRKDTIQVILVVKILAAYTKLVWPLVLVSQYFYILLHIPITINLNTKKIHLLMSAYNH